MKNKHLDKITAVIVLYNANKTIFDCLKNLDNINVIIADNGRNDPEITKQIRYKKNIIKYFKFKKNIGFGRACNFCQKYVKTEYTLLIEPDVYIDEYNILNLVNGFKKYPTSAVMVPTIINSEKIIIDELTNLPELNKKDVSINENKYLFEGDMCVNFTVAAVMLIKNSVIRKFGLFNKKIFLYFEDYFMCRWYKKNRIPIIKLYGARAIHDYKIGSSKKNLLTNCIVEKHFMKSTFIYSGISKDNIFFKKRFLLYFFRAISYLIIFNVKNSLKNFARLLAIIEYIKN
jgi:GT2 family glycosyltransferase